jgi:hypothetical protein
MITDKETRVNRVGEVMVDHDRPEEAEDVESTGLTM